MLPRTKSSMLRKLLALPFFKTQFIYEEGVGCSAFVSSFSKSSKGTKAQVLVLMVMWQLPGAAQDSENWSRADVVPYQLREISHRKPRGAVLENVKWLITCSVI